MFWGRSSQNKKLLNYIVTTGIELEIEDAVQLQGLEDGLDVAADVFERGSFALVGAIDMDETSAED